MPEPLEGRGPTAYREGGPRLADSMIRALRAARTAGYRLLDPVDRLARRAARKDELPPLSLRRHAGPVKAFESSTEALFGLLAWKGLLGEGTRLLDVGCGPGAVPLRIERERVTIRSYVGVDVHEPSIRWCRNRFAGRGPFRFELARIRSPYGLADAADPAGYRFPADDGAADLVLAKSLFTHLLDETARNYMAEIRRCLSPDGFGVLTAFVFDGTKGPPAAFPHHGADPGIRWRRRLHPHAAVAYDRRLFETMILGSGLEVSEMLPGFWPGLSRALRGQDTYVVRRAGPGAAEANR